METYINIYCAYYKTCSEYCTEEHLDYIEAKELLNNWKREFNCRSIPRLIIERKELTN